VTGTLPGADVRGFYQALGLELPDWAKREASVGCFADPDAHAHGDRDPSCSVNVEIGAWHCWGCGAKGGAYDAALARGRSARDAIELMIAHGLITRRTAPARPPRRLTAAPPAGQESRRESPPQPRGSLAVDERQLSEATATLARLLWPPRVLRDEQQRVWSRATLIELGCGWERGRVLIPIRNGDGGLRGVLRYAPTHDRAPKMLAAPGTRLGLIPHPAAAPSGWVLLVEGPPDMISARSRGLPALAVPGDDAWEPEWARLLAGRPVSIAFDCDQAGREGAGRIAADLKAAGVRGTIIDLAPRRQDGYDLTDWLYSRPELHGAEVGSALGAPGTRPRTQSAQASGR
jgi:Toprim-like